MLPGRRSYSIALTRGWPGRATKAWAGGVGGGHVSQTHEAQYCHGSTDSRPNWTPTVKPDGYGVKRVSSSRPSPQSLSHQSVSHLVAKQPKNPVQSAVQSASLP